MPDDPSPPPESPEDRGAAAEGGARRYLFALIPLLGLLELVLHLSQVSSSVPDSDWLAARAAVKALAKPDDLVVFAPFWADPIGREFFKDDVATMEREARPDDSRFPRAIEVSIRGAHLPELAGWTQEARQKVGKITLTTYANPHYTRVIDDLVAHFDPQRTTVWRLDTAGPNAGRESPCPITRGRSQTGNIGFGPATPGEHFGCPSSFVGISVMQPLDYQAHRCIYSQLPSGGTTRIRFRDVVFGKALHGHHAISWAQERFKQGTPVTISFTAGGHLLGRFVHNDGDSWKPFDMETTDLAGTTGELVVDISTANARERSYCFEAVTE